MGSPLFISNFKTKSGVAALLFLPMLFLADRGIYSLFSTVLVKSGYRYSTLYNSVVDAELLVMGDSRGKYIINAQQASLSGVSTFNLAANGTGFRVNEVAMQDYLLRNIKPKYVVFNLMAIKERNEYGGLENKKPFMRYSNGLRELWRQVSPTNARWSKLINTYYYNGDAYLRSLAYLGRSDQSQTHARKMPQKLCEKGNQSEDIIVHELSEQRIKRIRELDLYLRNSGTQLVLVTSPVYFNDNRRLLRQREMVNEVRSLFVGIPILYFGEQFQDCSLFADTVHLNTAGTTKHTELVLNSISSIE